MNSFLSSSSPSNLFDSFNFDFEATKTGTTIDVDVRFDLRFHDRRDKTTIVEVQSYFGRSTRSINSFPKTSLPKNEREKMEKEAKKAALIEVFRKRLGFTEFNDLCVDELGRVIDIEKQFQL